MKALPHVSSQINEKLIFKVIKENYAHIAPSFYSFISNWLIRAYYRYNQIDKFIIIVYLIHNNLKFYSLPFWAKIKKPSHYILNLNEDPWYYEALLDSVVTTCHNSKKITTTKNSKLLNILTRLEKICL